MINSKYFLIALVIILLLNVTDVESNKVLSNVDETEQKGKDQHYLIYVNNIYGEFEIFSKPKNNKRQETNNFVYSMLDKINNIIIDNKDTYMDPEKLEEIENNSILRKRTIDNEIFNYGDFSLVYPISSVNNRVVFYGYLSEEVANKVKEEDYVIDCVPNSYSFSINNYYNTKDILKETKWKTLSIRKNADFHLSLISQNQYQKSLVNKYDHNFYYPTSAGKGIDIVIVDTSFNFKYSEFKNTNERSVKCMAEVKNGQINLSKDEGQCGSSSFNHGEQVADIAGGMKHGVANKANIYGVTFPTNDEGVVDDADIFAGLQFVIEKLIRPNKTIINISSGAPDYIGSPKIAHYQKIIDKMVAKGAIVVTSAGNLRARLASAEDGWYHIPCSFNNTICVGGIDGNENSDMKDVYELIEYSNFGPDVDIYAPATVKSEILDKNKVKKVENDGTSFSVPLVSGVIASIMSENPDVNYTNKSILNLLKKNSSTFDYAYIKCYILNNGKHIVYSEDNIYHGCGVNAGNKSCPATTSSSVKKMVVTTKKVTTTKKKTQTTIKKNNTSNKKTTQKKVTSSTKKKNNTTTKKASQKKVTSSTKKKVVTKTTKKNISVSKVSGRCGPKYGKCAKSNECCSQYNYCGRSSDYCKAGCQPAYGICL